MKRQMVPCESTFKEVSFKWSNSTIWSTDREVITPMTRCDLVTNETIINMVHNPCGSPQQSEGSSSPGLVDFAVGLVNFVLNLPNGQGKIFEEFKLKKNREINSADQNGFEAS